MFLGFSVAAALLYAAWSNTVWRKLVMLAANVAFIASFTTSPHALLPLICFLAIGYIAIWVARFDCGNFSTTFFVVGTLFLFCWLKKFWFLSFVPFLSFAYLSVGLSYMFFRIMGMIIDARTDTEIAKAGPIEYLNFVLNFPTMIAGPIDRYQDFSKPFQRPTQQEIAAGVERVVKGFFKVLVLSSIVSHWQSNGTNSLLAGQFAGSRIWAATVSFGLYPIFLYFNFSGYSDIVIGIGAFFGKKYPENFDAPFASFNFIEFWSRWHMSLSFWLRDYVYTPLLGLLMQAEWPQSLDPYLGIASYFVTFFLIGIWHGSTVVFAIYGLLLALGVSICKFYQIMMAKRIGKKRYKAICANPYYRFAARGITYTWYAFCMICFWNSEETALHLTRQLGTSGMIAAFLVLLVVTTIALNLFEEGLVVVKANVSSALFGEFEPYVRSMILSGMIVGCIANAILTQKIDANIIYQAF